jgi:RND family efflux transporter MFP subunit
MRKSIRILLIAIVLAIVVGLAWYRIAHRQPPAAARRAGIPVVQTAQPVRADLRQALEYTGDMMAVRQADIFSKVTGNLEQVYVNIGTPVRTGQLLALIDTTELYQTYEQASATFINAKLNFDRTSELFDKKLVSKQDFDNSDATLRVAQATRDGAATRLSYAHVIAPFSGVITKRFLDPGALMTPNNTTLFTLMSLDSMKVIVNVLERSVPQVLIGTRAQIEVDAFPGRTFDGSVTRFSEAVDPATRTMAVEIDILNLDHVLKPGMFARVALILGERPQALTILNTALLSDAKGPYLYTVNSDTAHRVNVQTGIEQATRTEILSGLSDSARVIIAGQQFVKDGSAVIVQH